MSARPPEPVTPPALISESDIRTLAELHEEEAGRSTRRSLGSWQAVAGAHCCLTHLARAIYLLEGGTVAAGTEAERLANVQASVDVLDFFRTEAADNRRHYEKNEPDPIRAVWAARRLGALERALAELRPLVGAGRPVAEGERSERYESPKALRWPDGRPISEIVVGVELGKAEILAQDAEPWPYDPTAPSGWAEDDGDRHWQGPPSPELVRAWLTTEDAREALEEWLCSCLFDVDLTCPAALQRLLLTIVADQRTGLDDMIGAERLKVLARLQRDGRGVTR